MNRNLFPENIYFRVEPRSDSLITIITNLERHKSNYKIVHKRIIWELIIAIKSCCHGNNKKVVVVDECYLNI